MGLLDVGQKIWVRDPNIVWRSAEITAANGQVVEALDDNGQEHKLPLAAKDAIDHKEAWFLQNPANLTAVEDLTELSYLHEPAVLNTLRTRYLDKDVYTYCGIVLVAINPFDDLPIYTERVMREYHGKQMGELEPHLYALAEAVCLFKAYSNMANYGKNSSIVISGESGAGKTVSAVHCMRYFTTVGGSGGDSSVESKVLASNPIMEAFGNAKTTRNNNSSRFGKYISLQFDNRFAIQGAVMYTYLLEKSRVVFQAADERSYHIFYQLCASAWENCPPEFADFELEQCTAYKYISGGNAPEVEKVDDAATFEETRDALTKVGINQDTQVLIFKLLATILHIGNIQMKANRQDEAQCEDDDKALVTACRLLDVAKPAEFAKWLCRKTISTGREKIERKNTLSQALASRDAFAKHLYATLFDYIVLRINKSLETTQPQERFIGVLDIYGFELFKFNSFEQFCINYANEKLQQQFNQHVFKLEQEEYKKEKIEWSFIDFYDNQPCIDLIEDKLGILSLLDEEARLPKGSDGSFLNKMIQNHDKKEHFALPRFAGQSFIVKHFAADVEYQVENFLEKNKDAVSEELMALLTGSSNPLIQELFGPKGISTQQAALDPKEAKKTVGAQFKQSLTKLMETIYDTTPHYCRCIKPNQSKKAFLFEEQNTIEQLRACGVLETVRISAAGYPSRWEYGEFLDRYSLLLKADELDDTDDMKERCKYLLHKTITENDKFQFGITKIFFRAGVVAYLEKLRGDRMKAAIVMMQRNARRYVVRAQHVKYMTAIATINRYARGMLARQEAQGIRERNAATRIQAALRGWQERQKYLELRNRVVAMQALARALLARKRFMELKEEKCATMIQAVGRMFVARQQYRLDLNNLITIQNQWRCREARREFRQLKGATKDVAALKDKFKGLEQKLMELQQRLDAQVQENARLKDESQKQAQLASSAQQEELRRVQAERDELQSRVTSIQDQLQEAVSASSAVSASVSELEEQLRYEREASTAQVAELQARIDVLTAEKDTLEQQVVEMKKDRKKNKRAAVLHSPVVSVGTVETSGTSSGPDNAALLAENAALKQQVEQLPILTGEIENLKKKLSASAAAFMVAERAMTPVTERVVVPDPQVVAELEKVKVENAALLERLATSQAGLTADDMGAKLDAALAGKAVAEGEQARLESIVEQLRQELEESAGRAQAAVPTEVVREVKVTVPDPAVVAALEKLKVECATLQERLDLAQAGVSQDDAGTKLDKALADKAEAEGEAARLKSMVGQLEEELQSTRQRPSTPSLSDDGLERLAALDKENAELKRRLANSAVALDVAQKPVTVEKLVTDPALVAEIEQLQLERETLQQRLEAALEADSSAAAVDAQLAEAADARLETARLQSENERLEKRLQQMQQDLESTRIMASAAAAAAAAAAEIVAGGDSQAAVAPVSGGDNAELVAELEKLKEQNKRLQAAADHSVPKDFVDSLRERHAEEVSRYASEIRELRDQNMEYEEYFAQQKQNARGSATGMRRTPSVTAKHYDESAQADANGSVSSDDADIDDSDEDKEMLGMFIWNELDESKLIQELILDVTPPKVRKELPGFVAYVLFMCVRWADHINNAHQLQCMLTASLRAIQHTYSKNKGDLDVLSFWLTQCHVLLGCVYYSADEDGEDPGEYALANFDLDDYVKILADNVQEMYNFIIKLIQPQLQVLAVPAVLEYEEVAVEATTSRWSRRSKKSQAQHSFLDIIKMFDDILRVFKTNYLHPDITEAIFTQLAYFVGATCLNTLMLRKDLCTFQKACQMQINVQHVTNWLAQNKLETAMNEMMPLLQAVKLLMVVPTSVDDVDATRSMCANLNSVQIMKLLTMYTPETGEERVPAAVIRAIQKGGDGRSSNLVADLSKIRPLAVTYVKPTQKLSSMELPASLTLDFLGKV